MRTKYVDALSLFFIITIGLWVNWSGLIATGFWWTDEARHAMHGAFFADFLQDMPLNDPYDYVQRYFAQYPALAFNWYLPFFPIAMGLIMLVIGPSEFAAHSTIVLFWLIGVIAWYRWLIPRSDPWMALTVALVLLTAPVVVLWGRSVMLEAPAVGLCMLSVLFFQRYLDRPGHVTAINAGLVIMATLLVKQTTLFILPVLALHALSSAQGRSALWKKEAGWGIFLTILALIIIAFHAIKFGPDVVMSSGSYENVTGHVYLWTWDRWIMYAASLDKAVGSIISILALAGLLLSVYHRERNLFILPLSWLVSSYILCTMLAGTPGNNERYAFYAMPAIAFFAAYGIHYFRDALVNRWIWTLVIAIPTTQHFISAINTEHLFMAGYETAAEAVYNLPNNGTILFAGKHDGNFIFHLRQLDQDRQRVILRGDKTLLEMSVLKEFGIKSHVSSALDVDALLDKNWVRWIVIESRNLVGLKEFDLLFEAMNGPKYRLVQKIPTSTNVTKFQDIDVLIYENMRLKLPPDRRVWIDYPYLDKTYSFSFQTSIAN